MLTVQNIQVFYKKTQVLWDVSFRVGEKEIVVILGSNGAGKSTTLKTLAGLLHPRSGEIKYNGNRIEKMEAHRIVEKSMSLVPEGGAYFPKMSISDNLELGAYPCRDRKKVKKSLEWVYGQFPVLKERSRRPASTLSGGERQMLAIGRALMMRPRLLMLDEPSYGLAPLVVGEVFKKVERLREEGTTILVVEQSSKHALRVGDRGYLLENGRIAMTGSCSSLRQDDHVKKSYLGF